MCVILFFLHHKQCNHFVMYISIIRFTSVLQLDTTRCWDDVGVRQKLKVKDEVVARF